MELSDWNIWYANNQMLKRNIKKYQVFGQSAHKIETFEGDTQEEAK